MLAQGYVNYEISNFAKPGMACRHNQAVWRGQDYVGVGAGAHGRVTLADGSRVATSVVRQPEGYLERMAEGDEAFSSWEVLDGRRTAQEALFLGLRLAEGIDTPALLKRVGEKAYKAAVDVVEQQKMTDAGLLTILGDHLVLTQTGWPRLNGVLKRILTREPSKVEIAYEI